MWGRRPRERQRPGRAVLASVLLHGGMLGLILFSA